LDISSSLKLAITLV